MIDVYLDNNATTRPDPQVVEAMLPYQTDLYANPSSVHRFGQRVRQGIDVARGQVAALLHAAESEITFTGGGTEAINAAIRGLLARRTPRKRLVTSTVEHSATRELCAQLQREGFEIIEIPVDREGALDHDRLSSAIDEQTAAVSLIWANNETGVLFPMDRVAVLCQQRKVPLHCDATQAAGKMAIDVKALGFDAMTCAPHKFHGPKGVGILYQRRGLKLPPLIIGGPQELGRRGGTENVPGIIGAGKAAELASHCYEMIPHIAAMRDRLEQQILSRIPGAVVNGSVVYRVANTTNIAFPRLEAEAILLLLSEAGIAASAGAACSSGSLEPSPILLAMGIEEHLAHGAIRFSLSRYTTNAEIDRTLEVLPGIISRLRAVLPVSQP